MGQRGGVHNFWPAVFAEEDGGQSQAPHPEGGQKKNQGPCQNCLETHLGQAAQKPFEVKYAQPKMQEGPTKVYLETMKHQNFPLIHFVKNAQGGG